MAEKDGINNYSKEEYGEHYQEHILEMYKMYVEMADNISKRRMETNNFFISINTLLLSIMTFLLNYDGLTVYGKTWIGVSVIGLLLSWTWFYLLKSYRLLNSGKFKVVHEIERLLPVSPYDIEWDKLGRGKDRKKYWPISHIEVVLPAIMGGCYLVIIILNIWRLCTC